MCSVLKQVLGFIGGMALACSAVALEAVSDFSKAPANGAYAFASVTPKTLPDLLGKDQPGGNVR